MGLPDGTRCDCVTDTHAIEFDFGVNWAEALVLLAPDLKESRNCYYIGNGERSKILDSAEHHH